MCLKDIVIDTNILMHANNKLEPTQGDCIALIKYLLNSTEFICVDTAIDVDRSFILHEYFDKLRTHGTIGRNFIEKMLQWKRFNQVTRRVDQRTTRIINQNINHDKQIDKTFLRVTCNSIEKTLVSNDFEDFQIHKRELFKREIDIDIFVALDFLSTLE